MFVKNDCDINKSDKNKNRHIEKLLQRKKKELSKNIKSLEAPFARRIAESKREIKHKNIKFFDYILFIIILGTETSNVM